MQSMLKAYILYNKLFNQYLIQPTISTSMYEHTVVIHIFYNVDIR